MTTHAPERANRTMAIIAAGMMGLAALPAIGPSVAWAGSDGRIGTSGAPELQIPVGPRGSALGASGSGDVSGVEAIFWNPAGLATLQSTEALFSHTQYFADMKLNYAAIAAHAGDFGVLGFSAKVLSVGEVIVTTEQSPDGTGETLNPTFAVLGFSWARQFSDRVNLGATAGYVNEHIGNLSASGLAVDFGVQYATGWRGLKLGMTMKNIGTSMSYAGADLEVSVLPPGSEPAASNRVVRFTSASFEMPSYFTLATSGDAYRQGGVALRLLAAFQNNNFDGDNFSTGAEWIYREQFALRGSWFGTLSTTADAVSGTSSTELKSGDNLYSGIALGAGASVRPGNTRLTIDFAWRPVREFFDDVVEVGVKFRF